MWLDNVNSPADIKGLSHKQLDELAVEIRQFLIESLSVTGGHFGANLGVVELTLALHKVFDSPKDKLIWDVGHQAYVHKILTGRKAMFPTLRKFKGLSGFPKRSESEHDMFDVGHSSTSISAAIGYAIARDLKKEKHHVVAIIGDGAMTGGMAFEAMNHVGHMGTDLIVVLNDNEMSIDPNVGAMSNYLSKIRTDSHYQNAKAEIQHVLSKIPSLGSKVAKGLERLKDSFKYLVVPGMLFEEFGFTYMGPIDGHNIALLLEALEQAKNTKGPVLVHVVTKKGKGYAAAEASYDSGHYLNPVKIETGDSIKAIPSPPSYSSVFGSTLIKLAEADDRIIAITPAMPSGSGLLKYAEKFPNRFFDVGIAEQHSATYAAGLACAGMKPVLAIYSTFLQRAYDQVIHDICIQNLPVTIAIDRAGLVGADGETHQGAFDISFLRAIPNITIMMPKDENEMQHMLYTAVQQNGPVAVRYPRGEARGVPMDAEFREIPVGKAEILREGTSQIAILALGPMVDLAEKAASALEKDGIFPMVVNMRFVKPLDNELLMDLAMRGYRIITVEEAAVAGGMGSAIMEFYASNMISAVELFPIGLPDRFIEHGSPKQLLESVGITADRIVEHAKRLAPKKRQRA
ncbi:1-deoxy-D-xylulose-5-phosphate synthase [Effusibacillus lacus]|uniref:1-deoxy-D-xylulose-5-phosphate synthase n=1 Tax=Effusibacillus lacus TaxID=1348429 RepID=A0A292YR14_9BACL|nr:1-deoxy-D-xylulose-5-phosphate synthase [Effusibacillus lacus]TCS72515.1 1-deoxy-D-xylulose-5-phosphate synthase [Effusibacillus lacus]GAX90920.1 1-deoxy-D-xylulose-5-phosphate synthase [Effusibacillus lacus]